MMGSSWIPQNLVEGQLDLCGEILSDDPILFIITAYNVDHSPEKLSLWLQKLMSIYKGKIEYGNLIQLEKSSGRKIRQAIYARWSSS